MSVRRLRQTFLFAIQGMAPQRTHAAKSHLHLHTTLPLPSKTSQIDGIQLLRAVAVGLVAWFHSAAHIEGRHPRHLPDFGLFGVDIFFVISGFILTTILLRPSMSPGPQASWYFLKRRLIRIFPIYWFFAGITALRFMYAHSLFNQNFLPSFFLLPSMKFQLLMSFSWTLIFEMEFYYIISLVLLVTTRHSIRATIAAIAAAVALGAVLATHNQILLLVLNPMLLEFVLGSLVALAYRRFGQRKLLGILSITTGTAVAFYLLAFPTGAANGLHMIASGSLVIPRVLTWGIAAMMIVGGMVFWSPSMKSWAGRLAVVLGNSSYSAYLASALVLEFTGRLLLSLIGKPEYPSLGAIILMRATTVIAVFFVGWLCYQFIEWPLLRKLGRLTERKPAAPKKLEVEA